MSTHPAFLQKPNYKKLTTAGNWAKQAKKARHAGHYNICTLWLFRKAWLTSQSLVDYINYLAFRRDLGYAPTLLQQKRLQHFFRFKWQQLLWALKHRHSHTTYTKLLRKPKHLSNQELLKQYLTNVSAIQLVGNSGNLINQLRGAAIDKAQLVVRFNRCFSEQTKQQDTGSKTDIWVGAPDIMYKAPNVKHAIITGPDMLNWLNSIPPSFCKNTPLHSVPLTSWRELVRQLAAPPSAGLLVTHWFKQLAPQTQLFLCGFSIAKTPAQYHHADKNHQAVNRHNWPAEAKLLKKWQQHASIYIGCKENTN